jgi:glycine/D-amino acid oxidase-like deaminating enzyme
MCIAMRVWADAYFHAPVDAATEAELPPLKWDEALAREFGVDVEFVDEVPIARRPGLRIQRQARFHPRKYLAGLATAFVAAGGPIHEHSEVSEFCESPRRVKANGCTVAFTDVVIATHNPLVGLSGMAEATLFQTKLALYTTYVIAGRVDKGLIPDALWWDTGDPYRYLRIEPHRDHDVVIFGGEDHKTGQNRDTEEAFRRLATTLRALVPSVTLTHRWSGQVIETPDGLPYIGEMAEHQYAATGFGGNGLTFGTLSAMVIVDAITGRTNPWTDLFDPGRKVLTRGACDYLKENALSLLPDPRPVRWR